MEAERRKEREQWLEDNPDATVVPVHLRPERFTIGWSQTSGYIYAVDPPGNIKRRRH